MSELVVNDLEAEIVALLEARAQKHGRSLEDEVLEILRDAVKGED
jgi:plasmid stability protein